jgi:transposase
MLPAAWTLIELNPAHVTEQRRVLGKRGIKTDQSIWRRCSICSWSDAGSLVAPGPRRWQQLQAWAAMRHRRITAVIAVKNQLLGQMDRAFPRRGRCVAAACWTPRSAGS